jgi:type IV pilus assembly protein PilX
MKSHPALNLLRHQKGATLVMAMLILVLIMMIGIVAVGSSDTQSKLAGNLQFDNNAMNNAELAVSTAENWLSTGTNYADPGFTTYSSGVTPHLYSTSATDGVVTAPLSTTFTKINARCVDNDTDCASSYVIQQMSVGSTLIGANQSFGGRATTTCNKVNTYQIIGRGMGGRGARKTVVSFYSVFSCNAT